jgi:hypothetical protein
VAFDDSPFESSFDVDATADVVSVEVDPEAEDHVAAALNRLPLQFHDQPNVIAVLTSIITPMQTLENALVQVLTQRSVNIATGVTLTMLGHLVGQERNGVVDDEIFRRYVRARIAVNKSNGLPNTLINIARLILNDPAYTVTLHNEGAGTARMTIGSASLGVTDAVAVVLGLMLESAVAAGVRLVVEWSNEDDAGTYTLDSGPGLDTGFFANATDNGVVL